MPTNDGTSPTFRVLDAMTAPHGGCILRLRLESGEMPSLGAFKGARLSAVAPDGHTASARVLGFALFGGRPSNERFARTGRVDLHVDPEESGLTIGLRWQVRPER